MPQKNKPRFSNGLGAIIMAVLVLCIAVASWVFLRNFTGDGSDKIYKNITYTDALLTCQNYTNERYGKNLRRLTLDNHSSRWEQKIGQYKLFFKADLAGKKDSDPVMEVWVACDVSGRTGKIRDYDVQENKSLKTEAQRRNDGGLFGWP